MNKFHVWTTGCQMNKADSERLEDALRQLGLSRTLDRKEADVVVLNTCVVRKNAEDKAVGTLTSIKPDKELHPEKILAVMGCMVGPKTDALEKQFPYVDVFMPPQQYDPLLDLVSRRMGVDREGCIGPLTATPNVSTFIPIIHGCDKFCSFCIIPYRRGRENSRPIKEIVEETSSLVQRGVKEVTLLGQNVDSYGHDLSNDINLADLLYAVNKVEGLQRIRFLTSHPNDMDESIIDAVNSLDKVCEHINLPFQSGDDKVLKQMRRGYTNKEYRELVYKIRDRIPGVTLSTDLIVGFCGETNSQFANTLNLIKDIRFDKIHSAAYSVRSGTIAHRQYSDDVPDDVKKDRLKAIDSEQQTILSEINSTLMGETQEILVEGKKKGRWFGRNRNDKLVFFDDEKCKPGDMVDIEINETSPWFLQGSPVTSSLSTK